MDWHDRTIQTYDANAENWAAYFKGIGPRLKDIDIGLELASIGKDSARVIEIGCGDGRDAEGIVKQVAWYEGFDPSIGLLTLARQRLPGESFVLSDALNYAYPKGIDVVYAFASLLHINKDDVKKVLDLVANALKPGGVALISLKESDTYKEEPKTDEFGGERMFYYYNPTLIEEIAGESYKKVYEDHQIIGKTEWFTVALKKV